MAPSRLLITGSNRGIGYELVRQLVEQQNPPKQIFATCRDPSSPRNKKLKDLAAKHPNIVVIKLETTDANSIKEAAKEVEKHLNGAGLNLLINNAGIRSDSNLDSADSDEFMNLYSTNVVGPFLVAKELLPFLKKAAEENQEKPLSWSRSAIINVSSVLGSIQIASETVNLYQMLPYRCSKAALNMLTQCQSQGYKNDGILCTALHPGWVKTDLGGVQAPLTVEQSVQGILKVLHSLSEKHSGIFISWEGKVIPW
ncbi:C-signal-like [Dendropsophus ebraccatus]|uniref:C-signal-like n=1 Tax=Dendropsophus ebraccatus TaxID=150705 RepID=UPI0038310E82